MANISEEAIARGLRFERAPVYHCHAAHMAAVEAFSACENGDTARALACIAEARAMLDEAQRSLAEANWPQQTAPALQPGTREWAETAPPDEVREWLVALGSVCIGLHRSLLFVPDGQIEPTVAIPLYGDGSDERTNAALRALAIAVIEGDERGE